jgi:hypothetical protein
LEAVLFDAPTDGSLKTAPANFRIRPATSSISWQSDVSKTPPVLLRDAFLTSTLDLQSNGRAFWVFHGWPLNLAIIQPDAGRCAPLA